MKSWTEDNNFEESAVYEYFTGHHFLFIIYRYKGDEIIFEGFKRVFFDEQFITNHVRRLWNDVRELIMSKKLTIVRKKDQDGHYVINKSGSIYEAPNFPKKATHEVFIRGGAQKTEDKYKTLEINGMKMIPQWVWLSRDTVQKIIRDE